MQISRTPENIQTLFYQTQNLMYGFNYEVILGVEVNDNCFSVQEINHSIKLTYPKVNPEEVSPALVSADEFWEVLNEIFDYRGEGDDVSLLLNERDAMTLKEKQNQINRFLAKYLNEDTKIHSYPFMEGLPGYPVWWEYAFSLLNSDGNSLFIYGSASD